MATTEHTINDAIADLLRGTRFAWRGKDVVRSETTQSLADSSAIRPDILVYEWFSEPVVIETEVLPAASVEADAQARLRENLSGSLKPVLSTIALRLPAYLREKQGRSLKSALKSANDLEFALYTVKNDEEHIRRPRSGWLRGGIQDLSLLAQSATFPPYLLDQAANFLEIGINQAAGWLNELAKDYPQALQNIADELQQQDSPQTRRMAILILINAFIFHEHLAGSRGALGEVRNTAELRWASSSLSKTAILDEWQKILQVNYWSIFDIARRILEKLPATQSGKLFAQLANTAYILLENNLVRSHDLTGTVFQRLIADRKFLAAFYTTPASAALLVGLAVNTDTLLNKRDWSKPEAVKSLRIADFACGTGTLLTSAYQRISQLHELHGGNTEEIHASMMARSLVGCDILPAAAHLTATMLSGAYPLVQYDNSAIFTAPYGVQDDSTVALGSIDLMRDMALLAGSEVTAKAIDATQISEVDIWRFAPHESFDMVLMNPPFTRPNNHERRIPDTPNPNFAAFGASAAEQKAMAKQAKALTKNTVAHGSAGEASTFMALADRKIKLNGMLALVMPVTLLSGSSWEKCRNRLANAYDNLIVVSIAGVNNAPLSFSADTGMGECLVIGRRSERPSKRAAFVTLNEAPSYSMYSLAIAAQIRHLIKDVGLRALEDGPTGGNDLTFGNDIIGQALDAPLPSSGSWKVARIVDISLAQSAYQLASQKRLWLPTQIEADALELPMTTVSRIGKIGPYHLQVSRKYSDGTHRPFELRPLQGDKVPTYPVLAAHNAKRERTMMFEADHDGIPYRPKSKTQQALVDQEVKNVFASASHCHSNLDFRFNSQSTAMQFTARKTIGGTAWISIQMATPAQEKALVVWANTTLALLMFWWHASKQQPGRGRLTKTTLSTLPVLDVSALGPAQLQQAAQIFDDMNQLPLRPMHELDLDENRKELDRAFYGAVLGVADSLLADGGPLDILRQKLAREPSVRGNKRQESAATQAPTGK